MYAGGWHGWAQTLADGIKFAYKEDIIPASADKRVFSLAPAVIFVPVLLLYLVIPIDRSLIVEDLDVGLFFLLAIGSVGSIGVLMAGWSSANKYALIGALRSAGQLIAYELPIVLSAAAIAMLAGTLSLVGIVEAQDWPFIFWPPGLGLALFLLFLVGAMAEMALPPFDMPVAESELITGPFTEYTGMRFIFGFFFAETAHMIAFAAIGTTLVPRRVQTDRSLGASRHHPRGDLVLRQDLVHGLSAVVGPVLVSAVARGPAAEVRVEVPHPPIPRADPRDRRVDSLRPMTRGIEWL